MAWYRVRFLAKDGDSRPIKWPPVAPYWCTGYSGDEMTPVIVAYLKSKKQLHEFWPDAENPEWEDDQEIEFTDRFRKPDWY